MRTCGAALCLGAACRARFKAFEPSHGAGLVFCGYAPEPGKLFGYSQSRGLGLAAQEGRAKA